MTNIFTLNYEAVGDARKRLVKTIADHTGADAIYLGAPSFAYEVDCFHIDKRGNVSFDARTDSEEVEAVLEAIAAVGFDCGAKDCGDSETKELAEINNYASQGRSTGLTIEIPLDKVSIGNLTNLLESKETLIKKALGIEDIRFEIKDDRVVFPWFEELPDANSAKAYTHLIAALCKLSREQSRVSSKERKASNEKYAFRCFLLRLGFIGSEYKVERKILLKNLSGNSSWKNGAPAKEESECVE